VHDRIDNQAINHAKVWRGNDVIDLGLTAIGVALGATGALITIGLECDGGGRGNPFARRTPSWFRA
jgi:hypothetical protein